MKPGNKQTEGSIVPGNWSVHALKELADIHRGASPRPIDNPIWYDQSSNVGWVRISDVTASNGKHLLSTRDYLSESGIERSRYLPSGSLIMSICATVGMPVITQIDACIHDGFVGFTRLRNVDQTFLYYKLKELEPAFKSMGQTGSQNNLNSDLVRNCLVELPPLAEQIAIATALSDVDTLLNSLDALIAKKRSIKQGAMQELLAPKETDEVRLLVAVSSLKGRIGWQGLTTAEYLPSGDYGLVTGTDFVDGKINWEKCHFVDKPRYDQDTNIQLQIEDVLVTKDGTIGKVAYVDHLPFPTTLNSGVFVLRPKNEGYLPLYLYYVLNSKIFGDFLSQLQAGSTINHLYQKDFVNFNFCAPPFEEQRAIANILSDMDAEINALEQQREKTQCLKQGMMQELLTGKTRLI
jgi:type I restriction enzyme, S subunit